VRGALPEPCSPALAPYARAFADPDAPCLHYCSVGADASLVEARWTRGQFWALALRAAGALRAHGVCRGDCQLHCFSANRVEDLACRLAAVMLGSIPVTVNWQADKLEQVRHKRTASGARLILYDGGFSEDLLSGLKDDQPDAVFLAAESIHAAAPLEWANAVADLDEDDPQIVIFTSGSTGLPKGARHAFRSYRTNAATFTDFMETRDEPQLGAAVVNPLHHANATAIADWRLRSPNAEIVLFDRYSTGYWAKLTELAEQGLRIVAPLTARHFDFLETLVAEERLGVAPDRFKRAAAHIDFLLGSAPVGPSTVAKLRRFAGKAPLVRFGATETCLQALGTPRALSERAKLAAFERGWGHRSGRQPGYWIGRPHPPHTQARIVAAVDPRSPHFMAPRGEGEAGYLIVRGDNLMQGYLGDPQATAAVFHDGWYTGLLDVGFWLKNPEDGEFDFYWMSRESNLLIRGGANYAYEQINRELSSFLAEHAGLAESEFELAVVGLKLDSEHEDACCVTVSPLSERARAMQGEIQEALLRSAAEQVGKGAKPDRVRFEPIPKNFKGAILANELKRAFAADENG